ncbi:VRR-NUC domain-containing protein [Salinicola halophilus]|uniref:VRR-NUC domain-containing protein n=1 Tax=Salinicola halophilus TaxID=184065 RepID=UPI000DA1A824|nr:VRR-NUC domain-containing protein [Salinicola halophilus]
MARPVLDDPLYYLVNFRRVLDWLEARYADLLSEAEAAFMADFAALPEASQALLVRMVMRKGEDFRDSRLSYPEIGDTADAVAPLIAAGLVEEGAPLTLEALFALTTKPELRAGLDGVFADQRLSRSASKGEWLSHLEAREFTPRPLAQWLPTLGDRHYRLTVDAMAERFRLMFFGNLRQQWSEFVLADLGVYRFETVALDADSRAFSARDELESYHRLHRLRERFEADEPLTTLSPDLPLTAYANPWLERRRARLIDKIAYRLERGGELEASLALYARSPTHHARVREARVLELLARYDAAFDAAEQTLAMPLRDAEAQRLARLHQRLARKLGRPAKFGSAAIEPERIDLELPRARSVERAVAEHLSTTEAPVLYVENALVNALFGLLCWPAIFAPLPGAFFHPFHSGPADLHDDDFRARRTAAFESCFTLLDADAHREVILARFDEKFGIQSPFVFWEAIRRETLELALDCIPPRHLRHWFERLLNDVRANRAGMPDLIQFDVEAGDYRMIEVKGPGDRLQDNQKRWLAFCAEHAMPVSVCYVRWQAASADELDAGELDTGDSATASPGGPA